VSNDELSEEDIVEMLDTDAKRSKKLLRFKRWLTV
jgi:hypothetical protein